MTDDKIIKALECCGIDRCDDCPCWTEELLCDHNLELLALDLINRQAVEIESLKIKNMHLAEFLYEKKKNASFINKQLRKTHRKLWKSPSKKYKKHEKMLPRE